MSPPSTPGLVGTPAAIESEDRSLAKIFDDFYSVPDFQREFVWGEKEVDQLLQDINSAFAGDPSSEYFIGSIVVCPGADDVYELIDGQQRMTTAFITLCAIRDHFRSLAPPISLDTLKDQIASTDVDASGHDVHRYRVALQYEDSRGILTAIGANGSAPPDTKSPTRSVANILRAYHVVRTFLLQEFGTDEAALRKFYVFFTKNVKLIRIKTLSIARALKVFETINDRGVGLDSMDLLKNLMFMETNQNDFDRLKPAWKDLVDTIYRVGEKPLRFLRYFIFATYDVDRLREDEIYQWFIANHALCGYKKDAIKFVGQLQDAAHAYSRFIVGQDPSGASNRYLVNTQFVSGAARQHLILLMAGRHLPTEQFGHLCRHIENLFFAFVITREPTREFERKFAQWAKDLRPVRNGEDLKKFIAARIRPEQHNLAARFDLAFKELNEFSIQHYRLRYVLAKLTQFVNDEAFGPGDGNLINFAKGVDIEHILPQTPSQAVRDAFDQSGDISRYIYSFGNLCLIEDTINRSIGNGLFTAKRTAYQQSKFLLTKLLAGPVQVGSDTAINRAVAGLEVFDKWGSAEIGRRQVMLAELAKRVWDLPTQSAGGQAAAVPNAV
jgi:hypothetical protein